MLINALHLKKTNLLEKYKLPNLVNNKYTIKCSWKQNFKVKFKNR